MHKHTHVIFKRIKLRTINEKRNHLEFLTNKSKYHKECLLHASHISYYCQNDMASKLSYVRTCQVGHTFS